MIQRIDQWDSPEFAGDCKLRYGFAMRAEKLDKFHIPPNVIKRHVRPGQYVEHKFDSPSIPNVT